MIAVVLVTHNSQVFLQETVTSINSQTKQPDIMIAVDDLSTDGTQTLLHSHGFQVVSATSTSTDITTRVAQNFVQGVRQAQQQGATTVILGDHDDIWRNNRIQHQADYLANNPRIAFMASDGKTTEFETLRATFPVPVDFNEWDRDQQWRYTAKHSIATGGASAIAPDRLSTLEVPEGWLHDRWWSLRAVRESSMAIDSEVVIDYRLSAGQQVGLETQGQGNPVKRILHKFRDIPRNARKMKDIAALLGEN